MLLEVYVHVGMSCDHCNQLLLLMANILYVFTEECIPLSLVLFYIMFMHIFASRPASQIGFNPRAMLCAGLFNVPPLHVCIYLYYFYYYNNYYNYYNYYY